jgi:hypothetical protein
LLLLLLLFGFFLYLGYLSLAILRLLIIGGGYRAAISFFLNGLLLPFFIIFCGFF